MENDKSINGHRHKFYDVLKHNDTESRDYDDDQVLGAHLVHHGMSDKKDFDRNYRLFVLAQCKPTALRPTEQLWIDKLRTMKPFGLNQNYYAGDH